MLIKRTLLFLLVPLMFLSATVNALVVDLKGLPRDTTFEIDLGAGSTVTGETDGKGNATLSDEDDDDKAGFLLPRDDDGNLKDGNYPIINKATGERLGAVEVKGGAVTSTIAALNYMPDSKSQLVRRVSVEGGYSQISFGDAAAGAETGRSAAIENGFEVDLNTNDDADGYTFGLGYSQLTNGQWNKQGAITIDVGLHYNKWDKIKNSFTATSPEGSLLSRGGQKAEFIGISVGPSYTFVDNFDVFAQVGLGIFDLKDSGNIIVLPNGPEVSAFSDDRSDDTATFTAGLRYNCDNGWFGKAEYTWSLDDIGFSEDDAPGIFNLTFGYWFDL